MSRFANALAKLKPRPGLWETSIQLATRTAFVFAWEATRMTATKNEDGTDAAGLAETATETRIGALPIELILEITRLLPFSGRDYSNIRKLSQFAMDYHYQDAVVASLPPYTRGFCLSPGSAGSFLVAHAPRPEAAITRLVSYSPPLYAPAFQMEVEYAVSGMSIIPSGRMLMIIDTHHRDHRSKNPKTHTGRYLAVGCGEHGTVTQCASALSFYTANETAGGVNPKFTAIGSAPAAEVSYALLYNKRIRGWRVVRFETTSMDASHSHERCSLVSKRNLHHPQIVVDIRGPGQWFGFPEFIQVSPLGGWILLTIAGACRTLKMGPSNDPPEKFDGSTAIFNGAYIKQAAFDPVGNLVAWTGSVSGLKSCYLNVRTNKRQEFPADGNKFTSIVLGSMRGVCVPDMIDSAIDAYTGRMMVVGRGYVFVI